MSDEYKQFGQLLFATRRSDMRKLSVTAVANVAQCSRKTWRKYELGKGAPDAVQLSRVERAFGWKVRLTTDQIGQRTLPDHI